MSALLATNNHRMQLTRIMERTIDSCNVRCATFSCMRGATRDRLVHQYNCNYKMALKQTVPMVLIMKNRQVGNAIYAANSQRKDAL